MFLLLFSTVTLVSAAIILILFLSELAYFLSTDVSIHCQIFPNCHTYSRDMHVKGGWGSMPAIYSVLNSTCYDVSWS